MIAPDEVERDLVVVACAISAGIHAALAPSHAGERLESGLGFLAAAFLLAAVAIALTVRPAAELPLLGAAGVLASLIAGYALAVTTGVPALHPEGAPVDGLALATKLTEAVGLVAAARALCRPRPAPEPTLRQPRGTLT